MVTVTVSGAIKKLDGRYTPKGTAVLTVWLAGEFARPGRGADPLRDDPSGAVGRVGSVKAKF